MIKKIICTNCGHDHGYVYHSNDWADDPNFEDVDSFAIFRTSGHVVVWWEEDYHLQGHDKNFWYKWLSDNYKTNGVYCEGCHNRFKPLEENG